MFNKNKALLKQRPPHSGRAIKEAPNYCARAAARPPRPGWAGLEFRATLISAINFASGGRWRPVAARYVPAGCRPSGLRGLVGPRRPVHGLGRGLGRGLGSGLACLAPLPRPDWATASICMRRAARLAVDLSAHHTERSAQKLRGSRSAPRGVCSNSQFAPRSRRGDGVRRISGRRVGFGSVGQRRCTTTRG